MNKRIMFRIILNIEILEAICEKMRVCDSLYELSEDDKIQLEIITTMEHHEWKREELLYWISGMRSVTILFDKYEKELGK